jgi:hypothetical protein
MWLNEWLLLISFVTCKIPDGNQLNTAKAASTKKHLASGPDPSKSDNKKQKKRPSKSIAEIFVGIIKLKGLEAASRPIEQSQLLDQKEHYSAFLCKLESELGDLVLI